MDQHLPHPPAQKLTPRQQQVALAFFILAAILVLAGAAASRNPAPPSSRAPAVSATAPAGGTAAVPLPPPTTATHWEPQWAALASGKKGQIKTAVATMCDSHDPLLADFLRALKAGSVSVAAKRSEQHGLVIVSDAPKQAGHARVYLHAIFPAKAPILDAAGQPLIADPDDLTEVDCPRPVRDLIEEYIKLIDLIGPDTALRRQRATEFGQSGHPEVLPLLQQALAQERDRHIRHLQQEAICALQLQADEPLTRYLAAQQLGAIHGSNALAILQKRLLPDEHGKVPETDARVAGEIGLVIKQLQRWQTIVNAISAIFSGTSLGSILILMALGLAIIYGLMGVINMAHGEFMMVGAYATFVTQQIFARHVGAAYGDWFFLAALPLAFLVAGTTGLLVEALVVRHLYSRPLESLLATWGISLMMVQTARSIFGDVTAVRAPQLLSGGYELFPSVVLPYNRMFIIGVSALTLFGIYLLFYRTRLGTKIRAVTQNRRMAACLGIRTRRIDALAFFLGTGIAGLAGWALTLVGNVVPNMGQNYIVDSFLVVVVGGVGKLIGTVISGLALGYSNKFLEPFFEAVYSKVLILALVILFLQIRPTGLFPAKGRLDEH